MNQKHRNALGGATLSTWLPGDLIGAISDTVRATGQTRSYVIAQAVRFGLGAMLRANHDGKERITRTERKPGKDRTDRGNKVGSRNDQMNQKHEKVKQSRP